MFHKTAHHTSRPFVSILCELRPFPMINGDCGHVLRHNLQVMVIAEKERKINTKLHGGWIIIYCQRFIILFQIANLTKRFGVFFVKLLCKTYLFVGVLKLKVIPFLPYYDILLTIMREWQLDYNSLLISHNKTCPLMELNFLIH